MVNKINVSLICTLKNEESSIREFLNSLLSQSRSPDEIIIVDGGSIDQTAKIIRSYIEKNVQIKLIIKEGVNIAEGRNIAIKNTKHNIIASTDAGCRLDEKWLENLIRPFKEDPTTDVVAGWYEADDRTEFEKCVAELTYPKLERILKNYNNFLPSSRSVAFKKECWNNVGGYPEWLYTAEDTLLDINFKKAGYKFIFAPNAVVYWKVRPNLKSFFKQHFLYSRGNGEAGLFFWRYILAIYTPSLMGTLLFIGGFIDRFLWITLLLCISLYMFLILSFKKIRNITATKVMRFFIILVTLNLSETIGYSVGIIKKLKIKIIR